LLFEKELDSIFEEALACAVEPVYASFSPPLCDVLFFEQAL